MGLARWDGDTLVVESVGFNDVTWLGWEGYFHTDEMEVTERFRREGDLLFYSFTVNDPDVLMEPWTSITYVRRLNPRNPVPRRGDDVRGARCRPAGQPIRAGLMAGRRRKSGDRLVSLFGRFAANRLTHQKGASPACRLPVLTRSDLSPRRIRP